MNNFNFKLKYNQLVSAIARYKLAKTEIDITNLQKVVKYAYKQLVNDTSLRPEELDKVKVLRDSIIEIYQEKTNLLQTVKNSKNEISRDINSNNQELQSEIINTFFNNKKIIKPQVKPNKIYTADELASQITQIFNSEALLCSDGTINQTTQKILLERIYLLSEAHLADDSTIIQLLKSVTSPKIDENKLNLDKSELVNGIDISPLLESDNEDRNKLEKELSILEEL